MDANLQSDSNSMDLTINDFIDLSNGNRQLYEPIYDNAGLNVELRDDRIETEDDLRMDTLKEFENKTVAVRNTDSLAFENNSEPFQDENLITKNLEVVNKIIVLSESPANFTQATTVPSLPPGKLYHVFFSHCQEDRDWVENMIRRLESSEYGFKCCFADRDFDLGVPVFQNITKCIHSSKRTVIVMSPDFLESPWCSYETRITLELDLDTRHRLLIPVMLRPCKVPDFIGRLSYMEVDNEHFWNRFVEAIRVDDLRNASIQEQVGSLAIMAASSPFHFNPNFINAQSIVEVPIYACCGNSDPTSEVMPVELLGRGLQINPMEYQEIMTKCCTKWYVKYHCFASLPCYLPFVLLLLMTSILSLALGISFNSDQNNHCRIDPHNSCLIASLISSCTFFVSLILLLVPLVIAMTAGARLTRAIKAANEIAFARNIMVCLKNYGSANCACEKLSLIFYYYDWGPCLFHLKDFLQDRELLLRRCDSSEGTHENEDVDDCPLMNDVEIRNLSDVNLEIDSEATRLLIGHATEYGLLLLNKKMAMPDEQRHTRQGECLCQFVESVQLSNETSCLDRVFGTRSRHPWKRFRSLL